MEPSRLLDPDASTDQWGSIEEPNLPCHTSERDEAAKDDPRPAESNTVGVYPSLQSGGSSLKRRQVARGQDGGGGYCTVDRGNLLALSMAQPTNLLSRSQHGERKASAPRGRSRAACSRLSSPPILSSLPRSTPRKAAAGIVMRPGRVLRATLEFLTLSLTRSVAWPCRPP
nr:unnamed protein product [Digitaria exilis]